MKPLKVLLLFLIILILLFLFYRKFIGIENFDTLSPVSAAVQAKIANLQSQITALDTKVQGALDETKQNLANVSAGLSNVNGDAPAPDTLHKA